MRKTDKADIWIEKDYRSAIDNPEEQETGIITRPIEVLEKPLEVFYEQIASVMRLDLLRLKRQKKDEKKSFDSFLRSVVETEFHSSRTCFVRSWLRYRSDVFQLLCDAFRS